MLNQTQRKIQKSSKLGFLIGIISVIAVLSLTGFVVLLARGNSGNSPVGAGDPLAGQGGGTDVPQEIVMVPVNQDDHIRGSFDAPIKIVEYSDLECPFCKRHHPVMQRIVDEYPEQVAWVYRHFPLTLLHSKAVKEAEATECAAELGGNDGFWAMTDKIFEVTPGNNGLDLETLPDLAAEVGLDRAKFTECLDSGRYESKVREQYEDAIAAGGQGTPYNVIIAPDGRKIPLAGAYPFESFKEVIDSILNN